MKKLIIALGLVFGVVTFASAQQGQGGAQRQMPTPAERAARSVAQLETLKLSADQKSKLTEIYLTQGKQVDSVRASMQGEADMKAMRSKMGPLQDATNKKVISVLTDEQKKAYEALMEERRNRARSGNGGGNRGNN